MHEYIISHTVRCVMSSRGGGIEIDASEALGIEGAKITAYQNYLGGGIAGKVCSDYNFKQANMRPTQKITFEALRGYLKRYFYNLNNGAGDEYMQESASYERTQSLPSRAY